METDQSGVTELFIYTIQTMPGEKAKVQGDTSVRYRIKREDTSAPAKHKSRSNVIRTDLTYAEAAAMVEIFNEKEKSNIMRAKRDSRPVKEV